jgi:hypothetical protein
MLAISFRPRSLAACLCAVLLGLTAAGCSKPEGIEHYTVRKPPAIDRPAEAAPQAPPSAAEAKDRTLAAIVSHGEQGWFFKLTGPKDPVGAQGEPFTNFLKTVHFNAEGKPEWTLPEGWQARPGSDIRFATLIIPAEGKPLELSVTALPKPPGDDENYALVNINRWRGQLRLPPIALADLPQESTQLDVGGTTATLVNLLGTAAPGGMGTPPFSPGAGNGK